MLFLPLSLVFVLLIGFVLKIFEAFPLHMLVEVAIPFVEGVFAGSGFGSGGSIEYIIGIVVLPELPVAEHVVSLLDFCELDMSCGIDVGMQFFG